MFEEIKQHNALVRDQIYKGFVGGEALLEKARNEGDIHPNGKWVWTKLPSGKYDWRVRKDGSAKKPEKHTHEYRMEDAYEYVKNSKQHSQVKYAANSIIDGNDKKSVMNRLSASGVSNTSVRESVYAFAVKLADEAISDAKKKYKKITSINEVPDADFKRITKFLQTKDPESSNDQRHLEPEGMTDKELDMFRIVAEHFRFNNGQLSDRVRKNVGKWANLALEEQASRRKAKKAVDDVKFDLIEAERHIYDLYPNPVELKSGSSYVKRIPARESNSGQVEYEVFLEFKNGNKINSKSERLNSQSEVKKWIKAKIDENSKRIEVKKAADENGAKENVVKKAKVPQGHRISYEDDIVEVYDNKGKKVYRGMLDYCSYKHDDYKWNEADKNYDLPHGYKMVGKTKH